MYKLSIAQKRQQWKILTFQNYSKNQVATIWAIHKLWMQKHFNIYLCQILSNYRTITWQVRNTFWLVPDFENDYLQSKTQSQCTFAQQHKNPQNQTLFAAFFQHNGGRKASKIQFVSLSWKKEGWAVPSGLALKYDLDIRHACILYSNTVNNESRVWAWLIDWLGFNSTFSTNRQSPAPKWPVLCRVGR